MNADFRNPVKSKYQQTVNILLIALLLFFSFVHSPPVSKDQMSLLGALRGSVACYSVTV